MGFTAQRPRGVYELDDLGRLGPLGGGSEVVLGRTGRVDKVAIGALRNFAPTPTMSEHCGRVPWAEAGRKVSRSSTGRDSWCPHKHARVSRGDLFWGFLSVPYRLVQGGLLRCSRI